MILKRNNGTILIITLWILAILTALSVGVAGRMGLELKLAGYYRDNIRALYAAKAAAQRVIAEKEKNDDDPYSDFLGESWADDAELFKDYDMSEEFEKAENIFYSVSYDYKEDKDNEGIELYGMMDESSKININQMLSNPETGEVNEQIKQAVMNLLMDVCKLEEPDATDKVNALLDWMDSDTAARGSNFTEDETYYKDKGVANYCKNRPLDSLEELLLVKGFDISILYANRFEKERSKAEQEENRRYGIIDYITIYTEPAADGKTKVNINTVSKEVLEALGFRGDIGEPIADSIIAYRKGTETEEGQEYRPIRLEDLGKQLSNPIFGGRDLSLEEFNLVQNVKPLLTETSDTFRISATGKVSAVKKRINCVVTIKGSQPKFKYWSEE